MEVAEEVLEVESGVEITVEGACEDEEWDEEEEGVEQKEEEGEGVEEKEEGQEEEEH
jgi:hypothetical protein